jgi:hypothetical protein
MIYSIRDFFQRPSIISQMDDKVHRMSFLLDHLVDRIESLHKKGKTMALNFDKLIEEVRRNAEVDASTAVVLRGIRDELRALKASIPDESAAQAKIDELAEALDVSSDALVGAVLEGTVIDPAPVDDVPAEEPVEEVPVVVEETPVVVEETPVVVEETPVVVEDVPVVEEVPAEEKPVE